MRAHPRVGGENSIRLSLAGDLNGSSPRGRGKLGASQTPVCNSGLIPAWAGKTSLATASMPSVWAHPRVGGENYTVSKRKATWFGSSPRGRGKLISTVVGVISGRLIPAWAGKTSPGTRSTTRRSAHPRVGGENSPPSRIDAGQAGSSPRGRGKRDVNLRARGEVRLIPAWAGKTVPRSRPS